MPPVLVVREIARLPGDVPRLIEEERMRDLRRDVSLSRIVEPRVRRAGEEVAPDPPSPADLELDTRSEGVVRRPCLLLAIQRLAVRFAEIAGRDLPARSDGHEPSNVTVPGRWRRLLRSWRCRLRPGWRSCGLGGDTRRDARDARSKNDDGRQRTHSRAIQLTPTAVQACVIARSAALFAP